MALVTAKYRCGLRFAWSGRRPSSRKRRNSQELKEAFGIEQSFDQGLEFSAAALVVKRGAGRDGLAVIIDVARREVFRRRERSPVAGGDAAMGSSRKYVWN